ncbi:hypothetical protein FHX42_004359 [Saccharopolyspora lacisalsi]|uniref:Uncharacterized protein n=1 Tax=Halosaccharopolyspora lacisalsi TaxID=1000566 RepID=A0A839E554_9PSEU|nr:hypothetical protein [Halosaccharopolyspora lacisalsi]MBA8826975.1 hypothetical protein [Halosaccharopolyspora lacisalsi]
MADSDGVLAFREKMSGLVQEHTAVLDSVEKDWASTSEAAEQSAKEQTEKAQKLVERIGQRAEAIRESEENKGLQEISIGVEDEVAEEEDPEVEALSRGMLAARQAAPVLEPQEPPEHPKPEGWQVKAGRFGRQAEEPQAPAAPEPAPTPAPKPAPRRRAVAQDWDDDGDDLSARSWLQ